MKKKLVLLFFLTLPALKLVAQQDIFTFYSVNEGLAQSTVTCIHRDTFGLLWLGTGNGLSVFNGYEFRNFKSRVNDSLEITNGRIRSIQAFSGGKEIWVGTEDGLNRFSPEGNKVEEKIVHPQFSGFISLPVYMNDTASWFFLTPKGVYMEKKNSNAPQLVYESTVQYSMYLLKQPGKILFQTTTKELKSYDVLSGKEFVYELPPALNGKNIYNALELNSGDILLATDVGLWKINAVSRKLEKYQLGDKNWDDSRKKINAICIDNKERIWMSVFGDGLYVSVPKENKVRPAAWQQSGVSVQGKLKNISCLEADPYGIVWAGTDGNGLVKIITDRIFFGENFLQPMVTDSCNWFVKSFFQDERDRLWIGTFKDGIKIVDYKSETIIGIQPFPQSEYSDNAVICIEPARGNCIYFGTLTGLFVLDTISLKISKIESSEFPATMKMHINCIFRSKSGQVLVGTNAWLLYLDEEGGAPVLKKYCQRPLNTTAILEDEKGLIVSDLSGIFRFDGPGVPDDSLIFSSQNFLPNYIIVNAFSDYTKESFFAASNSGLIQISHDLKVEKIYTDANGLPDNMLYGIIQLPDQSFFVSTGKGVSVFYPSKNSFENYSAKDGLKADECNAGALFFSKDQNVYVGSVNGFNRKHFPFLKETHILPKIYFENPLVFNVPVASGFNNFTKPELNFNFNQNTFSFQIWQTDFTFSERTVFRYQLQDFDPELVDLGTGRFVRFTGVNPGEYRFFVGLTFPGYYDSTLQEIMTVKIIPPYWQSTWFRILAALFVLVFIVSAVYFVAHLRYKKAMRRLEMQRQLERVRIRISGDIHDDIGAGLTRIALSSDLVSRQLDENNPLRSKIKNVATSARDLSQSLKEVVWSVKPEYDELESMVSYFKGYCGELFEDTEITFSFQTIGLLHAISVSPEIRRNLFLIMKESCNNAMKHSGATKVEARFEYEKGRIDFSIKDNGCGMKQSDQNGDMNSSGMKNMKRRADAIGFTFEIATNKPLGCSVHVSGLIT